MINKDKLIAPPGPFPQMPEIDDKDSYKFKYVYPFDSLQQQIPTFFHRLHDNQNLRSFDAGAISLFGNFALNGKRAVSTAPFPRPRSNDFPAISFRSYDRFYLMISCPQPFDHMIFNHKIFSIVMPLCSIRLIKLFPHCTIGLEIFSLFRNTIFPSMPLERRTLFCI